MAAVISYSGDPYTLAGYTYAVFSGYTSTGPGGSIPVSWAWNFGDGQTGVGRTVAHKFSSAGQFTVTLTVTFADASTSSTTYQITVNSVDFSQFDKYVDGTGGNDITGDGSQGSPWKTMLKAVGALTGQANWNDGSTFQGRWCRINLKRGTSIVGDGGGGIGHGPLVIEPYGSGADPIITLALGQEYTADTTHAVGFGWSIYCKNFDVTWAAATDVGNSFALNVACSQIEGCDFLRGAADFIGPTGYVVVNSTFKDSQHNGMFMSLTYGIVDNVTSQNNGIDAGTHEIYTSQGLAQAAITNSVFDAQDVPGAHSTNGIKVAGGDYLNVHGCEVKNCKEAFDCGTNTADSPQSAATHNIYERNNVHDCGSGGIAAWFDDIVHRNEIFANLSGGHGLRPISANPGAGQSGNDFRTLHCTFYLAGSSDFDFDTTFPATNTQIKNCIFFRTSGVFYNFPVLANLTSDYNCFWMPGATADTAGLFQFPGMGSGSFNDWKAKTGKDSHSIFADPKFVNVGASNFHLLSSSPCIGMGTKLGEVPTDYDLLTRGTLVDIGAFEFENDSSGGGSPTPPAPPTGGAAALPTHLLLFRLKPERTPGGDKDWRKSRIWPRT